MPRSPLKLLLKTIVKSIYNLDPLDFSGLRTYPLASRKSKVSVRDFARPHRRGARFPEFLESLPRILGGHDLRAVIAAILRARVRQKMLLWGFGGHVIKVGLGPLIADLIERGFVGGIAMNGSTMVHDFELALVGNTSEDVEAGLGSGAFGMAEETGLYLNEIAKSAARDAIGLGESAGRMLTSGSLRVRYPQASVLIAAYRARVPVTVHLAIGTDIPHMHPSADGPALGDSTHHDFRLFCSLVKQMHTGGVYLNWGSAVVLPEVFLKAVSAVRNLGVPLYPITTANFDFIQQYRSLTNVVRRPTAPVKGAKENLSRGYSIIGHHEVMFPLVSAALVEGASGMTMRRRPASK
jgi:hypothetical protein